MDNYIIILIIVVSYIISVMCLMKLWKKEINIFRKLFWSIILLIPFFGLIAYGGLFQPPKPLEESGQVEYDPSRHGRSWN
jgi:amino acid transporter